MKSKGLDRVFNNADSFAKAFDEEWKSHRPKDDDFKNLEDKLNKVLESIKEHPLVIDSPSKAREIALFRIRLLKLE